MAQGKLGGGKVASDALEQLVGSLDDDAAFAHEVAGAQDRDRIVGERRKHVRTVRSAAQARNRPQRRAAWLIVLIVLALIALAARIDAAPVEAQPGRGAGEVIDGGWRAPALVGSDSGDDWRGGLRWADGDRGGDETRGLRGADEWLRHEADGGDDRVRLSLGDDDSGDAMAAIGRTGDLFGRSADDNDRDVLERSVDGDDDDDGGGLAATSDDAEAGEFTSLTADDDAPGGAAGLDRGSGALAMLDAELAPGDAAAGFDASDAAAPAGAAEAYEERLRHQRPSRWGRVDVGVSWRRRWSAPRNAPARNYNELWLVATWRR